MTKASLLKEYDGLVEEIDRVSVNPTWNLADWLVANVANSGRGPRPIPARAGITIADLAQRPGSPGKTWLAELRLTAERFPPAMRVTGVSAKAHNAAYQKHGDASKAIIALRKGGKLRDQTGPMESVAAIKANLAQRPVEEREKLARELDEINARDRLSRDGHEPDQDEINAAIAEKSFEAGEKAAAKIESHKQSRKARTAADKAGRGVNTKHSENVNRAIKKVVPDDDADAATRTLEQAIEAYEFGDLPHHIAMDALKLIRRIEQVPEWMEKLGHVQDEDLGLLSDYMLESLSRDKERVVTSFDDAMGLGDEALQALLNR